MSKQNYVGQYFTCAWEGWTHKFNGYDDVGECVWQDADNLLCVTYMECTAGSEFLICLVVPARISKHFNWFKTFAEFYEAVRGGRPDVVINKRVPNKDRDEVIGHYGLPDGQAYSGSNVAHLARVLKERPELGKPMVEAITEARKPSSARLALMDSIVATIRDADLSPDDMDMLVSRIKPGGSSEEFDPF